MTNIHDIELGIRGFRYSDLYDALRLKDLAELFYKRVRETNEQLGADLDEYIARRGEGFDAKTASKILTDSAPILSGFLAELFFAEKEREELRKDIVAQDPIWKYKFFVQRRAVRKFKEDQLKEFREVEIVDAIREFKNAVYPESYILDDELAVATVVADLVGLEEELQKGEPLSNDAEETLGKVKKAYDQKRDSIFGQLFSRFAGEIDASGELLQVRSVLQMYEIWSATHFYRSSFDWYAFKTPHPLDYEKLVRIRRANEKVPESLEGLEKELRRRDGFKLTDDRGSMRDTLAEIDYCLICHEREKDSCSTGLHDRDGSVKTNPLGIKTAGCPLDEKISEMHLMKKQGDPIASLALVTIDNPMCAGTGHRICNDCMKGCIFQKQEPVNIPLAETASLTDVLEMPYGFEIYALLTRWNPLNAKRPYPLPYNGKNVLVVGLGPAGYTLAHYLLNEGFGVVGFDGLKIEPLNDIWTGKNGTECPKPVKDVDKIKAELDERILSGFGGVSEYGITVRWDKNFLTMIQLILSRRRRFRAYGGIRFGGTLTIDDAWDYGFDHIAIATGAGRPTIVKMKNNLIRGIRQASDFLMALQLTGAFKKDTLSNLQVRLPAVVIGGGLTGIDTATELFAYYPVQVEKMLEKFKEVSEAFGDEEIWAMFDEEEKKVLGEFLVHGKEIRAERERAENAGEQPNFIPLVRKWGGVSLVYRKRLQDSPAYRLNHEEVQKALEEGIEFVELMNPVEAEPDEHNAVRAIVFERLKHNAETGKFDSTGQRVRFPARTVCVAAGTAPNVIYEKEFPGTFKLDEWRQFFEPHSVTRNGDGGLHVQESKDGFFTSYEKDGKFISYYGDNHPAFAGNVVKAMASAKNGYSRVAEIFEDELRERGALPQEERDKIFADLIEVLDDQLRAYVVKVERLTPTIVDVVVKAPLQARKFEPGQFYRLQNFETNSPVVDGKRLMMEGLALTGAWVDEEQGLLSMIVLEMGTSSRLCRFLKEGEEVVVMGPTGTPTEIPENETIMLAGGGLGNAVLFSIAKALREANNKVIYFAGYKDGADLFKREEIEGNTDQVVWATDWGEEIDPHRSQDAHLRGNIVEAMIAYAKGELGEQTVKLSDVDRIIAIGSDRMMNGVKEARYTTLKPFLKEQHLAIGSINSPMQCMMKEVCAQCLQKHVNPHTGEEVFVFSCFNQDQNLDFVDFKNLNDRLRANSIQEKLSNKWLDRALVNAQ
ncbi:MAG: pyridine nucleotide-disulfide oxidoreductase [Acidobacteria bacterium]|nr:MAG: pyridine nucleotide-disulfide oxidoreductase [Acidobacteriota bacterium]REJ99216.1 MAG: pyridine nucleotide-disulfide oxidoreductase [Acidobacteriota bacterium]REK16063.1 MAG: pyridine nucleotide-disulfide oxidoreductase [Acidobacteriota bacterium]REK43744.1 MAG: pyridine nucleotide-disulfide oxidoreductase [Acidobacteriota bacterium]